MWLILQFSTWQCLWSRHPSCLLEIPSVFYHLVSLVMVYLLKIFARCDIHIYIYICMCVFIHIQTHTHTILLLSFTDEVSNLSIMNDFHIDTQSKSICNNIPKSAKGILFLWSHLALKPFYQHHCMKRFMRVLLLTKKQQHTYCDNRSKSPCWRL